jgi:hypothetical protein
MALVDEQTIVGKDPADILGFVDEATEGFVSFRRLLDKIYEISGVPDETTVIRLVARLNSIRRLAGAGRLLASDLERVGASKAASMRAMGGDRAH